MVETKPKFKVIVSDGSNIEFCPVKRIRGYTDGYMMEYKPVDGKVDYVAVGRKYRPLRGRNGVYYVGKNLGNNSAAYLVKLHKDGNEAEYPGAVAVVADSSDPDCPGEDCSEIIRGDLYGCGLASISDTPHFNKKIIIAILIGIAVIFFLVRSGALSKIIGG
jgi:hypothetical protein